MHTHERAHTHVRHIDEAAWCPGPKRVQWNTEYITSIHSSRSRQIKHRKYSGHQIHLDKQTPHACWLFFYRPGTGPAVQQMVRWCWSGRALAGQTPAASPCPQTSGLSHTHQLHCHTGPSIARTHPRNPIYRDAGDQHMPAFNSSLCPCSNLYATMVQLTKMFAPASCLWLQVNKPSNNHKNQSRCTLRSKVQTL